MKKRYLIARSNGANNYWSYYKKDKNDKVLFESRVENAIQFLSRDKAFEVMEYLGIGIFEIKEIWINENL